MTWYMESSQKRAIRRTLMLEQNGACIYCRREMTTDWQHERKARFATLDHLVPIAQGGTNDPANLVLCCRLCNNVKADSTLEEFVFGLLWIWLCKNRPMVAWASGRALVDGASKASLHPSGFDP